MPYVQLCTGTMEADKANKNKTPILPELFTFEPQSAFSLSVRSHAQAAGISEKVGLTVIYKHRYSFTLSTGTLFTGLPLC